MPRRTLLLGATTYRGFVSFWPHALAMPGLTVPSREIAEIYAGGLEKVVVSDTLTAEEAGPWRDSTRIVPRADAPRAVSDLRAEADSNADILVFGSPTMWNALLLAGLVDELQLMVGPAAIGGGTPAFGVSVTTNGLELRDVRRCDGSSNVLLVYAVSA